MADEGKKLVAVDPTHEPIRINDTKCGADITKHCIGAVVNGQMLVLQPLLCPECGGHMFWKELAPRVVAVPTMPEKLPQTKLQ